MVCIKFTARSRTPIVSPKFSLMTSDEAPEVSAQPGETLTDQPEESLADQQLMASTETTSACGTEFDHESQSGDSGDS
jgi:hypothetical protein